MHLSSRVASLLIACNVATLGALAFVTIRDTLHPRATFDEITAERINIVSPAGQTVIAISNQERIAAPVIGGKAYSVETSDGRELMAGMIFFNQAGDEMGGLVFNSFKLPNGRVAGIGHLSFDRYDDNQVLSLEYSENAAGVKSGLTFYDRPGDGSFKRCIDLIDEARTASPERVADIREALAAMRTQGELGAERVFVGSAAGVAQCVLKDSRGRVRARLMVDENDEARLEFLDADGVATSRFPG